MLSLTHQNHATSQLMLVFISFYIINLKSIKNTFRLGGLKELGICLLDIEELSQTILLPLILSLVMINYDAKLSHLLTSPA